MCIDQFLIHVSALLAKGKVRPTEYWNSNSCGSARPIVILDLGQLLPLKFSLIIEQYDIYLEKKCHWN